MDESTRLTGSGNPGNRNLLINAAFTVFSEKGYHAATLDDIVCESGLTHSNLQEQFEDKEDLYYHTCHHAVDLWLEAYSDKVSEETDALGKLLILSRVSFLYPIEHPEVRKLLEDGLMMVVFVSERYAGILTKGRQLLQSILEEGVEHGIFRPIDCNAVADMLFDLFKYYTLSFYTEFSAIDAERFVSLLEDILSYGLVRR